MIENSANTFVQWYLFYSQKYEFVPQTLAQIHWGHNRLIISKIKDIQITTSFPSSEIKNIFENTN